MKLCLSPNRQSGQILVAVVLVMVVSLIVGISVSSRSLSSLRSTTYTTQATSAFHAAEAGVEKALYDLDNSDFDSLATGGVYADDSYLFGSEGSSYDFTVEESGGGGEVYVAYVPKDSVAEIKLGSYAGNSLEVCWDEGDIDELVLLVSYVGDTVTRDAYYLTGHEPTWLSGGTEVLFGGTPVVGGYVYNSCTDLTLAVDVTLIRLTPLHDNATSVVGTTIAVSPAGEYELPAQAYVITSIGSEATTQRTLKVTKTLPALPSIFDFAIYSGSTTDPISK